jgi:hypothetical protein
VDLPRPLYNGLLPPLVYRRPIETTGFKFSRTQRLIVATGSQGTEGEMRGERRVTGRKDATGRLVRKHRVEARFLRSLRVNARQAFTFPNMVRSPPDGGAFAYWQKRAGHHAGNRAPAPDRPAWRDRYQAVAT